MSANTLGTYERGIVEPDSKLFATYQRRFGVNLNWLIADSGEMFGSAGEPAGVQTQALADAVMVVEEWLEEHGRTMTPVKKAEIAAQLYQVIVEDIREGHPSPDRRRARQFLRLVVSNGGMNE